MLPVWVTEYFANRSADPRVSQKKLNPALKVDSLRTAFHQLSDILLVNSWTQSTVFRRARENLMALLATIGTYFDYLAEQAATRRQNHNRAEPPRDPGAVNNISVIPPLLHRRLAHDHVEIWTKLKALEFYQEVCITDLLPNTRAPTVDALKFEVAVGRYCYFPGNSVKLINPWKCLPDDPEHDMRQAAVPMPAAAAGGEEEPAPAAAAGGVEEPAPAMPAAAVGGEEEPAPAAAAGEEEEEEPAPAMPAAPAVEGDAPSSRRSGRK